VSLDDDLAAMTRDELVDEVRRLKYRESLDRELPRAPVADVEYE
jgi:hypothetical protein